MREGHSQSDEHWNCFKDNVGEISKKCGGAHMGFSEHTDTILNWTELTALMRADPVSMEARRVSPILMPITCAPGAMPLRSGWSGKFPAEMQATCVPWAPVEDSCSKITINMFLEHWITLYGGSKHCTSITHTQKKPSWTPLNTTS